MTLQANNNLQHDTSLSTTKSKPPQETEGLGCLYVINKLCGYAKSHYINQCMAIDRMFYQRNVCAHAIDNPSQESKN